MSLANDDLESPASCSSSDSDSNCDPAILVPGAAGSAGIAALLSLRNQGYRGRVIATDGEPFAAGFLFSDAYFRIDNIDDPIAYLRVLEIIRREHIRLILPTSARDTMVYAKKKADLHDAGIMFAGCDGNIVALCDDKLEFWHAVSSSFPMPPLVEINEGGPVRYPCFVKRRFGSGSKGAGLCEDKDDWRFYKKRSDMLIAQEVLTGPEYSVDVLSDFCGEPFLAVVRERLTITDGVSTRIRLITNQEIENMCFEMARHLKLKGLCCIQLKRDHSGKLYFLEVNARVGGSAIVSALAGVDLLKSLVDLALGRPISRCNYTEGIVVRYFSEGMMPNRS